MKYIDINIKYIDIIYIILTINKNQVYILFYNGNLLVLLLFAYQLNKL